MRMSEKQMNLLVGSALLALLPLAWLQFRWISEVSEADKDRRQMALQAALERIGSDVDRDAGRLQIVLTGYPGDDELSLVERVTTYQEADEGIPVAGFLVLRRADEGGWDARELEGTVGKLRPVAVPEWWRGQPLRDGPILARPPAVMGRAFLAESPEPGVVVALLDSRRMFDEYLPRLVRRHLGEDYLDEYAIEVVPVGEPREGDASVGLVRRIVRVPESGWRRGIGGRRRGRSFAPAPAGDFAGQGIWELQARHKQGSLEAAVGRTRRRNLVVSGATLVLLGLALVALQSALRRARRLAKLQREFTAGVSHELRTPLAVIVSAGDNLAGGYVHSPEKVRTYGELVRDEGTRLTGMVDQVLRFSELEAERIPLDRRPLQVSAVLAKLEQEMRPVVEREGGTWDVAFNEGSCFGDASAIHTALRNLVENALRHGGGEWIGLRAGPKGKAMEFTVEDRGGGIDPADLPHLFEPFYRGGESRAAQRKGSGLGLALVDRIARAHGGSVRAANQAGGGARFTLTIPCE